ncbi:MAG: hypothetical protein HFG69_05150 [Hungatella sp.]|jgi:hypothetical protein|nr:hypothetical protein [Hungatella sp.]
MKEYDTKEQIKYVEGFQRFESRGVPVYIDGQEPKDEDWNKIFQVRDDGSFYMCDYVGVEDGTLKEIHFDKVYNR